MFFSFLSRFIPAKTRQNDPIQEQNCDLSQINFFHQLAKKENGLFFKNFDLFYQNTHLVIDLLLFIPERGICFAEEIKWDSKSLQGATIEKFSPKIKKEPSTHLERTEALIHQKLEDILSFDSTRCERFFWMSALREDEFDTLDPSFHQLLPKERLIFSDTSEESVANKITALMPKQSEPYSTVKIIGSLRSHTLLLPSESKSYGDFLSDEQQNFLETIYEDTVTTLYGEHNSGKSTVIIRKALLSLLKFPKKKILIITPTLVGGEILRNELISLSEYGALKIELSSLTFCTPQSAENIKELECFQAASMVLCDDAHVMERNFIDTLVECREKRWLLLSMYNEYYHVSSTPIILYNNYQKNIPYLKIPSSANKVLLTLLLELRGRFQTASADQIMVILPSDDKIVDFKEAIDEYFGINSRLLTSEFSLQYQNLDDLIITAAENAHGLHVPYVYLIASDKDENYSDALSRASESATIITFSNPKGEENG